MTKVVVLDGYTANPGDLSWEPFREFGELTVYDRTPNSLILERIGDAEYILTNKTPFMRETLAKLPNLKYIGAISTGYNVIDTLAARDLGITVTNIPEYATFATAQMTIALLLELTNRVGRHDRIVHEGAWTVSKDFCFTDGGLTELLGKTLGLVGYGKIARRTALIAQALGMTVRKTGRSVVQGLTDGSLSETVPDEDGMYPASMETLLKTSDVISFHCPLTDETRGMANREMIRSMKDGVFLVNTSRGPVLNEKDVADALASGKVAGLAVDVLSDEPPKADNPLLTAPNCIITPHIAWAPVETRQRLLDAAYANFKAFLSGNPVNVVS